MAQVSFVVNFVIQECCNCGMQFAVTEEFEQRKRRDHTSFYCPAGHGQHFKAMSDIEKVRREKIEAENRLQVQLNESRHAQLVAEKALAEETKKRRKIEKRIASGVCPCCNRQFDDLHRHMKSKHKEFALPPGAQKQLSAGIQ